MAVDTVGNPGGRRRERQTGRRRERRLYVQFDDTELEVIHTAARREGMAPAAWAGRQLMAVAQEVLVPVSRDAGDVLRELVEARVRLRETVSALRALTGPPSAEPAVCTSAPGASGTPTPGASGTPTPGASGTPTPGAVPGAALVLEEALRAVSRVDQATVQVMRERRSRS
ncbi:hypothetical protein [Streptomyces sp. AmelKG-A3]|uniref:hypothetical protein n=1 Tax=Streptomyces sp. AmelKG-A3 TaxID=1115567 RepID=UPI00088321D9|nr:hypothetical protein [Streptomyces sp. AmelKG-A3]SDC98894.1 hypothetical protein F558DRAFT_03072 [Streptomyces sp. AmelKG-A3]